MRKGKKKKNRVLRREQKNLTYIYIYIYSWPLLRLDPCLSIGNCHIAITLYPSFGPFLALPAPFL